MISLLWVLAGAGALLMSAVYVRLGRAQRAAAEMADLAEPIVASQEGLAGILLPPETVQDIKYLIAAKQPFHVRVECRPNDAGSWRRAVDLSSSPKGMETVELERAWAASPGRMPPNPQEESPHDR